MAKKMPPWLDKAGKAEKSGKLKGKPVGKPKGMAAAKKKAKC